MGLFLKISKILKLLSSISLHIHKSTTQKSDDDNHDDIARVPPPVDIIDPV